MKSASQQSFLKENVSSPAAVVGAAALAAAWAAAALLLGAAALVDITLPAPLTRDTAPPHRFIAQNAREHLVNLTSIGPRVAGSYENEVLAVRVVVEAVKTISRGAAPHVRLDLDVHTVSGAFPLAFFDGMNHVYQDVSNVVVRVSAAGESRRGRGAGGALLLNCHIDTVPDSPGASDDGAGCAVLLETLRALAASRTPPRHDAVFLFNAAEENVLQASHGFITQHKWAKSVRAFINIEACGAGGREVLFQAGPHNPWIVEMYAGAVPHPFASSLAQELFESGLIPADTDFRIFRDFGKLSGVDLAWSANGYVYHTALDTAERVSPAVLQRTGDNVLALAHGMLASERLESAGAAEADERQPVFFDVAGLVVVSARAPAALLATLLALALALLDVHLTAGRASRLLFVRRVAWWGCVARGAALWLAAAGAGLAAACSVALALHAADARLMFYSRPWLLGPLYAAPALAAAWMITLARGGRWLRAGGVGGRAARGWWPATALHQGGTWCSALALAACAAVGLRSGFLPWLWTALPAAAGCLSVLTGGRVAPAWWWAGGAALPALQTWYLALGSLRMFVPVTGRAGSGPVPPDVVLAALTAALALGACSWLLPLALASRSAGRVPVVLAATCLVACLVAWSGDASAPYAPDSPQRLMVFHTQRTVHITEGDDVTDTFFWVPVLDVNSARTLREYGGGALAIARAVPASECSRWPYCGMPYYLPVLGLVGSSLWAPASSSPRVRLSPALRVSALNATHSSLVVEVGHGAAHAVLIVAPAEGSRVVWSSAVERPLAGSGVDLVYFFAVHSARRSPAPLTLVVAGPTTGMRVSVAGHAMFGDDMMSEEHAREVRSLPDWVAPTGWGVDLHLYRL